VSVAIKTGPLDDDVSLPRFETARQALGPTKQLVPEGKQLLEALRGKMAVRSQLDLDFGPIQGLLEDRRAHRVPP